MIRKTAVRSCINKQTCGQTNRDKHSEMNRYIVVSFCCDLSGTYLCLIIYCMSYLWHGISSQPTWFVAVCVLPPVPAGLPSWGVWAWEWQQCVARRLSIQRRPEPCGSGVPADAFLYSTVFTAKIIAYCHTPAGPFQGTLHKLDSVRYILHFNCPLHPSLAGGPGSSFSFSTHIQSGPK